MSPKTAEREAIIDPVGAEAPVTLLDNKWVQEFSEAMAYGYGYQIDVAMSDDLPTSMTSLSLIDRTIKVGISRQLIERAETEDQLDFLGFNILHELGHAKRFVAESPETKSKPKDSYFKNIVDDIAINYNNARKTRFFNDITAKAYDEYLFPPETRAKMASQPRHQQFMETLLVMAMTTDSYRKPQSPQALAQTLDDIGCVGLDQTVVEKLSQVVNFSSGKGEHNLLRQIREYGDDLPYYNRVISPIRDMYDELYKEDEKDQKSQPGPGGEGEVGQADNQFDYSDSGGCQHGELTESDESTPEETENEQSKSPPGDEQGNESKTTDDEKIDFTELGKKIGGQIADIIKDNPPIEGDEQVPPQLSAEQLARLRKELGLAESDFQGFLDTVNKYRGEIVAITDMILQLKRERQDNFLAPSHEISARGHRIHVNKLLGYLASGSLDTSPDIWKTPAFQEKTEFEFDGADFYFLCDVSGSMQGAKATAASESAVVLSQGIQDASFEVFDDVPPVRIQVQAFGQGDEVLCALTDAPANADLGRMYSSLRNPNSGNTQVSGALAKIKPAEGRLTVVLVLSDGHFHDQSPAESEGKRLEESGAVVVQCVFGGASVGNLSVGAKRMDINGAADLPNYLFGVMPELIETLRNTHHA